MHPGRSPSPDPSRVAVRISDPGDVAASLPALLGFRPRESVVLIGLSGAGRVGLTVRGDLPSAAERAETAAVLTRSVRSSGPAGVLLAVVSEAPDTGHGGLPHREVVHEVVVALARAQVPVREALLVRAGRWWSYDCPHPCCAPGEGTPLPEGVPALEAASVAAGVVVERDRAELARRIRGPGGAATAVAYGLVGAECAARVGALGADAVADESWAAVRSAAARCRPVAPRDALTDREVARVVWGLRDTQVRDRALEFALGPEAAAAEILWTECTRRAPAPLDVAPATLLAVSAWLRGDGAMANVALTHALAGEPSYALARLLAQALAECLPPEELRALIESASARPGARRAG